MPRLSARQSGFGLIEILITVFVIAIGLLSGAGLQLLAKRNSYDAVQRTTAATLAQDIVERIRSNPGARDNYLTDDAIALDEPSTDCLTTTCTTDQIAAYDLWTWSQSLQGAAEQVDSSAVGGLASPQGCIQTGANCGQYTVAITWRGTTPIPEPDNSTPADDPALNSCGISLTDYDDPAATGDNYRMRRILTLDVFVSDPNAPC